MQLFAGRPLKHNKSLQETPIKTWCRLLRVGVAAKLSVVYKWPQFCPWLCISINFTSCSPQIGIRPAIQSFLIRARTNAAFLPPGLPWAGLPWGRATWQGDIICHKTGRFRNASPLRQIVNKIFTKNVKTFYYWLIRSGKLILRFPFVDWQFAILTTFWQIAPRVAIESAVIDITIKELINRHCFS